LRGLEKARPLFEHLGVSVAGLRLKLVCDRFLRFDRLETVACPWSEASEPAEIAAAAVGIAWMPDDDWSRGKCGLKVIQYLAAGLPVVANPVGIHRELVRHGVTGFLADTPAEWTDALRRLGRDAELRQRLGRAGRALVEQRYDVAVGARQWLRLLENLAPRSSIRSA
jgi:glycosyltransferase involved in cell wall biosynthesis